MNFSHLSLFLNNLSVFISFIFPLANGSFFTFLLINRIKNFKSNLIDASKFQYSLEVLFLFFLLFNVFTFIRMFLAMFFIVEDEDAFL
ncbi:MAG: hypothetical protein AD073_000011 [Mycoplasmataceae bacterium]|nr:MAG: hypothetical protein AD073_000011 [Mycoplasmataceae bacterium]